MSENERSGSDGNARPTKALSKTRMRAGHRGSVTRILGQLGDALTGSDTRKLKQLKLSLKEKLDTRKT